MSTRLSCWTSGGCPGRNLYGDQDYHEIIEAIRTLAIRGAPAIGVAAAMGAALGALALKTDDPQEFRSRFQEICREIAAARPTAVNLFWALDRVRCWCKSMRPSPWPAIKDQPGGRSPDHAQGG